MSRLLSKPPADVMAEAVDLGPYPPRPNAFAQGQPVTLTQYAVHGWFAVTFLDDDRDHGEGLTHRIVGRDGQIWEGRDCVAGWRR